MLVHFYWLICSRILIVETYVRINKSKIFNEGQLILSTFNVKYSETRMLYFLNLAEWPYVLILVLCTKKKVM